ncbi:pimeloyl-ACP methyl ester esterase BioH [Lysobacter xanthus]
MHIERIGRGPSIALIHGWAMHGGLFRPLVERLADRYTLHLVDLPGHGRARGSDRPLDPHALADELVDAVPDAVWLGWSLGGQFALRNALAHPDRVRGLVMLASSPRFVIGEDWPFGVKPTLFRDFGDALANDFRGTLDGFLALEALGSPTAQAELRDLRAHAFEHGEPTPAALLRGLDLLGGFDARGELPGLRVPSLWISGRRDRLVPAGAMPAAAALATDAETLVIAEAGHAPFLAAPDAVAGAIDAFVARLAVPA